ncbi:MAG: cation transport protein [Oscillospiraceae bacterium]|nr:cation transport protein [Oscillospiraceae bacterium]
MGEEIPALKKRLKAIPPVRLIVGSFLVIILVGAVLLALPVSARNGMPTAPLDALFTSTSAVCVTGLVLFDTWSHWNLFGQAVILLLIQIGGLGLVTFTTGFSMLLRRKLGFRDMQLAVENTAGSVIHVKRLIKIILFFTFSCESIGALLLMLRFVPQYGSHGIWVSFFTAISAYCNAGFDILGFTAPGSSLTGYFNDPLVTLTVAALIVTGGLGFVVINDIFYAKILSRIQKQRPHILQFHSQIVLRMTLLLIIAGTLLFFICENGNTLKNMNFWEKLNASFFQSITTRTAGFNVVDTAAERDLTKTMMTLFMFIGASPASTGGGIKTTTFVVLVTAVMSVMRGSDDAVVLKRRLDKFTVYRAMTILTIGVLVVIVTAGIIMTTNSATSGVDALFEATSAFGTVGLTANVTPHLTVIAKLAVICAMYIGRVGPVSLGLAFTMRRGRHSSGTILPEGKIVVG